MAEMRDESEPGAGGASGADPVAAEGPAKGQSIWKRPVIWIGGILTALVVAAATAFGSGVGHDLFSATVGHHGDDNTLAQSSSLPVLVNSADYVQSATDGFSFAFPESLNAKQAASFSELPVDWDDYVQHAKLFNGAIIGDAAVQVVLRGNSSSSAVITNISVVKSCSSPLDGTLLESPAAAEDTSIYMGFNLDDALPIAQKYQNGQLYGSYFAAHTITLTRGQVQTLVIHVETAQHFCQFTFEMQVDTANGRTTEMIKDGLKPFAVTGIAKLGTYRALYAGGVISPSGNDAFTRVTATTLERITGLS